MTSNNNLVFYILRQKSDDLAKDFPDFIYHLKEFHTFVDVIQNSPNNVSLSGSTGYKSELEYISANKPELFNDYAFCCQLTIGQEDYQTFGKLRYFLSVQKDDYRIYSNQLNCYLPEDVDLVSLEFGSVNITTFETLKKFSLLPVYYSQDNRLYYAINPQAKVFIINRYLLEYIYEKQIPESTLPELANEVAKNLNHFSALYNKNLIPKNFYEYYQRSSKIINNSHFDINNPGRKVFVKPYVFEFRENRGEFYTYAGPDGASMLAMSKILRGETLDTCLKRILSEDLKIAQDYLGAVVTPNIEFDRDREGILTPRLVVLVYVEKIIDKPRALQMSQTGWHSVDGSIPKLTPNKDFQTFKD